MIKRKIVIILTGVITVACILNMKIFETSNVSAKSCFDKLALENPKKIVCILKYQYTTGVGWFVEESNDEQLRDKNVAIESFFDLRLLKDNKEFEMDYNSKIAVVVKIVREMVLDNNKIIVIKPQKMLVLSDKERTGYYIKDMSMNGLGKGVCGVINRKYHLSY